MVCSHISCATGRAVWLPLITHVGLNNHLKKHPYCEKCGIIKNIEAVSHAKTAYDTAFDHSVGHGRGYWRIITEYSSDDSFDQDIKIKQKDIEEYESIYGTC